MATTEHSMTVAKAAEMMGVSQQFVRVGLQKGVLPFGSAVQITRKKFTYFISRQKFYEYLGIKGESECQTPA